ncbi:MAG: cation:proton antiporter [Burkholderiaceae bacterium]|jgi:Kef-type K+ transport system membrane component KefB|nr:MAG: cation:proton antiporter [Burkholderiaceae bacterium]
MDAIIQQLTHQFQLPLRSPILIFSLILFIILLTPIVLERIRTPGIIGLIISGIIIGPHGFNILSQSLFVDVFSTIGLLYIMFLAGLDLNLVEFKANRNKSLVFGLLTFCVPFIIGFPVCYYLIHLDIYASLLVASIFATHTLVTYPIVSKYGISKDLSVAVTVGGTILTDTGVLIVLAILLGSHSGGLTQQFWIRLGISLALFSIFMFVVVPKIGTWFFRALDKRKHSHYVFVLAVMFLSAFLAEVAGLEGIIGAFAAGLALNKLIPHSSALMNRIEFMGNSLFIPFFLISVGMIVDIHVIVSGPMALIIAAALTITAIIGKYAAAWATQMVFRFSKDQRNLIFGLSSAHAAATLAVVLVGYRQGIVGDSVLNGIVLIILVTCVFASFVTEHAARHMGAKPSNGEDLALNADLEMEQILVPLSDTTKVENLLRLAVLVKDKASTHPLAVLNVVPNTEQAEKGVALAKKAMAGFLSEATAADVKVNVMATIDHSIAHGISRTAREIAADIIILGWPQSEELLHKLLGYRLESLLYHTQKSLFICSFPHPIVQHGKLFVVVPPHAEVETGFPIWLDKLARLSIELSIPIELHCAQATYDAIQAFCAEHKITLKLQFKPFDAWEEFFIVSRDIEDTDLLVVVSARRGARSHNAFLERLPTKVAKHFADLNKILIYPQ